MSKKAKTRKLTEGLERGVLWFLALALIVPLSIDNAWKIPISEFHLRPQYLSFALFGLWALLRTGFLRTLKEGTYPKILGALAVTGLLGILIASTHPLRAVAYWVWILGTMIALPALLPLLLKQLGRPVLRLFAAYVGLGVVVSLWDLAVCRLGMPSLEIALVNQPCRPHFFYQEPSYYAGFLLFSFLVFQRYRMEAASWIALLGLFLSGSRMGWIGGIFLILVKWGPLLWKTPPRLRLKLVISGLACLAILVPIAGRIFPYSFTTVTRPLVLMNEQSSSQRINAAAAAMAVFRSHPLFGVGPGNSGAYYIDQIPQSHPYHTILRTWYLSRYQNQRKEPLANDLYTEILAEWGLVGFLLIAGALILLIQRGARAEFTRKPERVSFYCLCGVAIACAYITCPTLPRFDLWFCLSWLGAPLALKSLPGNRQAG